MLKSWPGLGRSFAVVCVLGGFCAVVRAGWVPVVPSEADSEWYMPAGSDEVVYIGPRSDQVVAGGEMVVDEGVAARDPWVVLDKRPIARGAVDIEILTDAGACEVRSGTFRMSVPVEPGVLNRLSLDGDSHRPRVKVQGREVGKLRGAWVRAFHLDKGATLTLTFVGATYVNLKFSGPGMASSGGLTQGRVEESSSMSGIGDGGRGLHVALADQEDPGIFLVEKSEDRIWRERDQQRHGGLASDGIDEGDGLAMGVGRVAEESVVASGELPAAEPVGPFVEPDYWTLSLDAGLDYTTHFFYRGIGQENQDHIVQTWAEIRTNVFHRREGERALLRSVDLYIGLFNSHHWGPSGLGVGEKWSEFDFLGGVRLGLFDRWELEIGYVNRTDPQTSAGDVHQYEFKVTYDDHDPRYDFQLWPHVLVSVEFDGQSDAGIGLPGSSAFGEGIYLELGIRPQFVVHTLASGGDVTLAVPARVGLSLDDYYEDASAEDDTFGFFDIGFEFAGPLGSARGEAGRSFDLRWKAGLHVLFLGESLQLLSKQNGTGGGDVEMVGTVGVEMNY